MESVNTFEREKPEPKPIQVLYKDPVLRDQDRQALMVELTKHASPEVKKLLDEAGYSSTDKLKARARDPEKTKA